MTEADIIRVQNNFVATASRVLTPGFEWLEPHAAHGYLFNDRVVSQLEVLLKLVCERPGLWQFNL